MTQPAIRNSRWPRVRYNASWEAGELSPNIRLYPSIYDFHGSYPAPDEPQALGARLTAWRRARGISMAEAARMAEFDPGTLGRLERHPNRPHYNRILEAASRLLTT